MRQPVNPGAVWSREKTVFTLWAPSSLQVELRLYKAGSEEEAPATCGRHPMVMGQDACFTCTVPGDLNGTYYDYLLTDIYGNQTVSADPEARACGLNGSRSMVVDLSATDPVGWQNDLRPAPVAAPVIWETHVKDFSHDPSSGVKPAWRGKYLAFTQADTALTEGGPTCVAYLKRLGVTHVQLQPIADFQSTPQDDPLAYNWGYDIGNYNVPEGSYATDPARGEVRIRECKQMIQSLHQAGLGVILDVVYNHTYRRHSWLDRTAPGRYYRHDKDGNHLNGSGCGNETASEKEPFRRYMIRSVLYWAREYHVDGFRFDLMGVHDVQTMNRIRDALDELPGGRDILLIGEPWAGGPLGLEPPLRAANKENARLLSDRIGIFSDVTRNTLSGSPFERAEKGYASGRLDKDILSSVKDCMTGLCLGEKPLLNAPSQAVHYVSCHDNYALWDRLQHQEGLADYDARQELLLRRQKLMSGIYLTCPGIGFFQSGEEFCRTKYGDDNTYRGPAALNALKWRQSAQQAELVDWYRGLIGLRKELLPALTRESVEDWSFLPMQGEGCLMQLRRIPRGGRFGSVLICVNPTDRPVAVTLPEGIWTVLCDGVRSDLWQDASRQAPQPMAIPALGIVILGK